MGNNGIAGTDLIIAVNTPASCHHYTVIGKSTAFCNQQIIPAVFLINMGSFNPLASCLAAVPDNTAFSFKLKGFRFQFI